MQLNIITSEQLNEDPEQFGNYFCVIAQETSLIELQIAPMSADTEHWLDLTTEPNKES